MTLLPKPTLADRGVVALVALLSALVVVGTALGSGWLRTTADEMAAQAFAEAPYGARQVHVLYAEVRDRDIPADAATRLAGALAGDLAVLLGPPRSSVTTTEAVVEALPKQPRYSPSYLAVAAVPDARDHLRIVAGRFPRPGTTQVRLPRQLAASYDGPRRVPVVEVALERTAARAMDVGLGSYLDLLPRRYSPHAPDRLAMPRVVGLFKATTPYPSPLDDVGNLRRPAISDLPELSVVRAAALAADEATVLQAPWATRPDVRWTFDPTRLPDAAQAAAVVDDARRLAVQPWPAVHDSTVSTAMTGLGDLAAGFVDRRQASDTLAGLVLAALASAGLTLLLAAAAVLEWRRREVVAVLRARGAGTGRLVWLRGGEAVLAVAPGAAVAAVLLPLGHVALPDVGLALLAAAACAVLLTGPQVTPWRRIPERLRLPARDALQVVTVLVALGLGVALVDGGAQGGAADPLLLVLPVLLGAAGAVLVVRGVRVSAALGKLLAGRGRRLSPLVGTGQAAATAERLTVPAAALVLGLGSALLGTAVADTLQRGADRAAWSRLGADVRISQAQIDGAALDRIRDLPGVTTVAPVYAVHALLQTSVGRKPVQVLAVDPAALSAVTRQGPEQVDVPRPGGADGQQGGEPAGEVAALVSDDLELGAATARLDYAQADAWLSVAGRVSAVPGVTGDEPFVLVDADAFRSAVGRSLLRAQTVLVTGSPDVEEVEDVVHQAWPTAVVESGTRTAQSLLAEPVANRTLAVARASVAGSALVAVLAGFLAVALGGPLRRRTRAVLHALGAGPRQARGVSALEVLPATAAAAAAGVAAGLLLMGVLGRVADLDAMTQVQGAAVLHPDPSSWLWAGALLVAGLGLLLVAAWVAPGSRTVQEDPR